MKRATLEALEKFTGKLSIVCFGIGCFCFILLALIVFCQKASAGDGFRFDPLDSYAGFTLAPEVIIPDTAIDPNIGIQMSTAYLADEASTACFGGSCSQVRTATTVTSLHAGGSYRSNLRRMNRRSHRRGRIFSGRFRQRRGCR